MPCQGILQPEVAPFGITTTIDASESVTRPPHRCIAGADAIAIAEQKAKDIQEQANACRDLSTSLAYEDAEE